MALIAPMQNKSTPRLIPVQLCKLTAEADPTPLPILPAIDSALPKALQIRPAIKPIHRSFIVFSHSPPHFLISLAFLSKQ